MQKFLELVSGTPVQTIVSDWFLQTSKEVSGICVQYMQAFSVVITLHWNDIVWPAYVIIII